MLKRQVGQKLHIRSAFFWESCVPSLFPNRTQRKNASTSLGGDLRATVARSIVRPFRAPRGTGVPKRLLNGRFPTLSSPKRTSSTDRHFKETMKSTIAWSTVQYSDRLSKAPKRHHTRGVPSFDVNILNPVLPLTGKVRGTLQLQRFSWAIFNSPKLDQR